MNEKQSNPNPRGAAFHLHMAANLRTDHAGETGAVWIYLGVLAVSRDPELRAFAKAHLKAEESHLRQISELVPAAHRSKLLGPWRVAGFLTGALPALVGPRTVYKTIEAVETFVDEHYAQQVTALAGLPEYAKVSEVLAACQADEVHHRDEATGFASKLNSTGSGIGIKIWTHLVGRGSRLAVKIAYRV